MLKMALSASHLKTITTKMLVKQSSQMMKLIGLIWSEKINELNQVSNHSNLNGKTLTRSSSFGMTRSNVEKISLGSKHGMSLMSFLTLSLKMINMEWQEMTRKVRI